MRMVLGALMLVLAVSGSTALGAASQGAYVPTVVAGHSNDTLYAFDMQSGSVSWAAGAGSDILDVEISRDNRFVVAGCSHSLRLYDINGTLLWTVGRGVRGGTWFLPDVNSVSISANGSCIAAAHSDNTVRLYSNTGVEIWAHNFSSIRTVDLSSDGRALMAGGKYNTRYYSDGGDGWDAGDSTPVWSNSNGARIVAVSGNGQYAVGGLAYDVHLYGSTSGTPIWSYHLLPSIVTCDISLDGTRVAAGNDDLWNSCGAILYLFEDGGDGWDSGDDVPVWSFDASASGGDDIRAIRFSSEGGFLSVGGADHYAKTRIFATKSNVPIVTSTLVNETLSLGMSHKGRFTASCGHTMVWVNTKYSNGPVWIHEKSDGEFNAVAISECPVAKLVTGGGWVPGDGLGSKRTFGFNAHSEGDVVWGQLQFNDHGQKTKVHSDTMKTLLIYGDTAASFSGECRVDGVSGYNFECEVEDRGEPGRGVDKFSIGIRDASGNPYYSAGDVLGGGNIQIHTSPDDDPGDCTRGTDICRGSEPDFTENRADQPRIPVTAGRISLTPPHPLGSPVSVGYQILGLEVGNRESVRVTVEVCDLTGRLVRTLVNRFQRAGQHVVEWDGKDGSGRGVAPGMYFCRLTAGDSAITGKLILLR